MSNYTYEMHVMSNSLLPFIFHKDMTAGQDGLFNWHENIEILCCVSGSGYVKCNSDTFAAAQGDIVVINSNCPHSTGSCGTFVYCCLIVDNEFCEANGIPVQELHFQEHIRDSALFADFGAVAAAFAPEEPSPWDAARIRHAVLGLLIRLCSGYARPAGAAPGKSVSLERVKKAMTYIRSNLAKSMTLDEIADFVGISKYRFSREFKELTGETVIDSINILRCKEAKQRIEAGMSVSAAAMSCGFENLSYFTRTFRKHFGQVPSKFLPR